MLNLRPIEVFCCSVTLQRQRRAGRQRWAGRLEAGRQEAGRQEALRAPASTFDNLFGMRESPQLSEAGRGGRERRQGEEVGRGGREETGPEAAEPNGMPRWEKV